MMIFFKISQNILEKCFSHVGYYIESRGNRAFFGLFWGLSRAQCGNLPARNLSGRKPGTRPRGNYTQTVCSVNAGRISTAKPGTRKPGTPGRNSPGIPGPGNPETRNPGTGKPRPRNLTGPETAPGKHRF